MGTKTVMTVHLSVHHAGDTQPIMHNRCTSEEGSNHIVLVLVYTLVVSVTGAETLASIMPRVNTRGNGCNSKTKSRNGFIIGGNV